MTVPTNPEELHSEAGTKGETNPPARTRLLRGRAPLMVGATAVGLTVAALVLTFPELAAPIGTSAGVVAVVVPLVRSGS
ncbi:hypothetical protein ABT269_06520 [Streptomyces viridosporus]|uniref:hypothetical protein n=1 Tax=Streptomyces viridosporus TaxID=67581 RepID=UPI003320ADB4